MKGDNGLRNDPINGVQRNLEEQAEQRELQKEIEQEQREDNTEESENERYEVETQFVNTSESGEGSAHTAKHLVTDTEIGVTVGVVEKNLHDFGYGVSIFANLTMIEEDDWKDVAVEVTEVKHPDVGSIAQKFTVENALDNEDDETIDIVIWDDSLTIDVEEGDALLLSSVVANTFDDEVYLTVNSNSEVARFSGVDELQKVADKIESFVRANNSISKEIRM